MPPMSLGLSAFTPLEAKGSRYSDRIVIGREFGVPKPGGENT